MQNTIVPTTSSAHPSTRGHDDLAALARAEVERWYACFYAWSRGLVGADDVAVRPIERSLAEDFRVVLTDGRMMDRDAYGARLRALHGKRRGSPASEIHNLTRTRLSADTVLAVFDLCKPGVEGKKVDTALLRRDPAGPLGVRWVYVHESEHAGRWS